MSRKMRGEIICCGEASPFWRLRLRLRLHWLSNVQQNLIRTCTYTLCTLYTPLCTLYKHCTHCTNTVHTVHTVPTVHTVHTAARGARDRGSLQGGGVAPAQAVDGGRDGDSEGGRPAERRELLGG